MTEVGIVGLPQSGKSSLLAALTGTHMPHSGAPGEVHRGVIPIPDERVERLSEIFKPKKTTHATIQFTDLVGAHGPLKKGELFTPAQIGHLRDMDLLVLVIRLFTSDAVAHPLNRISPGEDLSLFLGECLLADLAVAEKRLERIEGDLRKGGAGKKKDDLEVEKAGLLAIKHAIEEERPVLSVELTPQQRAMYRGFGFLTGKKIILVVNSGDLNSTEETERLAALKQESEGWNRKCAAWGLPEPFAVNARLELELREMVGGENLEGEEALEYFHEVGLESSSRKEMIRHAYASLGLVSFLTAGEDEVRAWTIPRDCPAPAAAGVIHSDLEKGFIRAEVVGYDDFIRAGSLAECRKHGTLRLEGKDYIVKDGDILNIRFSV
ncbi:MAG: Ribosome-binding ATPase YchF [bacterium]|nr:Ribosome-binding ATPase YchF [bacterium]